MNYATISILLFTHKSILYMIFLAFCPQSSESLPGIFLNALDHHHQVYLFKCLRITLFFLLFYQFNVADVRMVEVTNALPAQDTDRNGTEQPAVSLGF